MDSDSYQRQQQLHSHQLQPQTMNINLGETLMMKTPVSAPSGHQNDSIASLLSDPSGSFSQILSHEQLSALAHGVTALSENAQEGGGVSAPSQQRSTNVSGKAKNYVCNVCTKAFAKNDDLKRHKRIHTGEKPFACNVCGRCFGKSNDLKRHHTTHTGEKPYICPYCHKKFSRSADMKKHARRTHPNEVLGSDAVSSSTDIVNANNPHSYQTKPPPKKRSKKSINAATEAVTSSVKQEPMDRLNQQRNNLMNCSSQLYSMPQPGGDGPGGLSYQLVPVPNSSNNGGNNGGSGGYPQQQQQQNPLVLTSQQIQEIISAAGKTGGTVIVQQSSPFAAQVDQMNQSFQTIDASSLNRAPTSAPTFQTIDVSSLRRPSDILNNAPSQQQQPQQHNSNRANIQVQNQMMTLSGGQTSSAASTGRQSSLGDMRGGGGDPQAVPIKPEDFVPKYMKYPMSPSNS